jgi:hypothetical protein
VRLVEPLGNNPERPQPDRKRRREYGGAGFRQQNW